MSTNRVERLEQTVTELESTVDGLTEELVESKERIRILEAELDSETPSRAPQRRLDDISEAQPDEVAEATVQVDDTGSDSEAEDSGSDDIIVA